MSTTPTPLNKRDFVSDQEVRWCPGCGDYAILASVQAAFAKLGIPREKFVIVSGIGCASRFPYYMEAYGFHSVHGRAPGIATGIKLANPELSVWLVTGDGDALAIGGNHFIHAMRRNIDLKVLLFNNRIYGLTKGQYSPTSEKGKKTVSTPFGSIDRPFDPLALALGAGATFVARSVDRFGPHLQATLDRAARHKGAALVEIYQNCLIFNEGAFGHVTDKEGKVENALYLEHGKPLRFGKDGAKGIRLGAGGVPEVVAGDDPAVIVHDENSKGVLPQLLAQLQYPEFPVPLGVFRAHETPTLDFEHHAQIERARAANKQDLQQLLTGRNSWVVR